MADPCPRQRLNRRQPPDAAKPPQQMNVTDTVIVDHADGVRFQPDFQWLEFFVKRYASVVYPGGHRLPSYTFCRTREI